MPCVAVAVIGPLNNPLYIRTFLEHAGVAVDASTQLHYIIHAGLDIIEERGPRAHPSLHPLPRRTGTTL